MGRLERLRYASVSRVAAAICRQRRPLTNCTMSRTAGAAAASTSKLLVLDPETGEGASNDGRDDAYGETGASSTAGGAGGGGSMGVCASSVRTCWIFQRREGADMVGREMAMRCRGELGVKVGHAIIEEKRVCGRRGARERE